MCFRTETLRLYHPYSQPTPIPTNPVENLQVQFSSEKMVISWEPPFLGYKDACSAFNSWIYRIEIEDFFGKIHHEEGIIDTRIEMKNNTFIQPNTVYSIRVSPYSLGGVGPWSIKVTGRTLSSTIEHPKLYWSNGAGIQTSDLFGKNMTILTHERANSMAESNNVLFYVREGKVMKKEFEKTPEVIRSETYDIANIVVCSWGQRIYYSIPSLRVVRRISFSGKLELTIDVDKAFIQLVLIKEKGLLCGLSGDSSVICSKLNGDESYVLYSVELWNSKKILGIAANENFLYMIIQIGGYTKLYQKHLFDAEEAKEIKLLQSHAISDIYYFDGKIAYLQDERQIVTLEIDGNGVSSIDCKSYVNSFYISAVDTGTTVQCPASDGHICVIPDSVSVESIAFSHEKGNNFTLKWKGVENSVSPGNWINYTVTVLLMNIDRTEELLFKVDSPLIVNMTLPAHTFCNISIIASTIHAASQISHVQLLTPQLPPSEPTNLGVYWIEDKYTLKWFEPDHTNGKILYYKISCIHKSIDYCKNKTSKTLDLSFDLSNGIYEFSVTGVTEAGIGKPSNIVMSGKQKYYPEPKIFISSTYPPEIKKIDVHTSSKLSIPIASVPQLIEYLPWIDSYLLVSESRDIKILNKNSKELSEIYRAADRVEAIAIDHFAHFLYYASRNMIFRLDLDGKMAEEVNNLDSPVNQIHYHPNSARLFFLQNNELLTLSIGPLGNANTLKKVGHVGEERKCNCPPSIKIDTFSIFPGGGEVNTIVKLVIRDKESGNIFLTDEAMCSCRLISETKKIADNFLLKTDLVNIYIISKNSKTIQSFDVLQNKSKSFVLRDVEKFAVGVECQYCFQIEDTNCLKLQSPSSGLFLKEVHSLSATFSLPVPRPLETCNSPIPLPTTRYKIHVQPGDHVHIFDDGEINKNNSATMYNLQPNTKYNARVSLLNYYMKKDDIATSSSLNFRTAESSPSVVRNLSATVQSPFDVTVFWEEPSEKHSDLLLYELHWTSEEFEKGSRIKKQMVIENGDTSAVITDMHPSYMYYIWVVAKSGLHNIFTNQSISDKIQVKMFDLPNQLKISSEARTINITWMSSKFSQVNQHYFQYSESKRYQLSSEVDNFIVNTTKKTQPNSLYEASIKNLTPGKCYDVSLFLMYSTSSKWYEFPELNCVFTKKEKPLVPGIPYITTEYDR